MEWKELPVWVIGAIVGVILWIINTIMGHISTNYLGSISRFAVGPNLFGLIPCGRTCYGYWSPITLLEIVLICAFIGWIIGKIKQRKQVQE